MLPRGTGYGLLRLLGHLDGERTRRLGALLRYAGHLDLVLAQWRIVGGLQRDAQFLVTGLDLRVARHHLQPVAGRRDLQRDVLLEFLAAIDGDRDLLFLALLKRRRAARQGELEGVVRPAAADRRGLAGRG